LARKLIQDEKTAANGSICAIGSDSKVHQQQSKAQLQQMLDIVLKGNKQKVINSVNIKHQRPG
jgi:hypothetical protein